METEERNQISYLDHIRRTEPYAPIPLLRRIIEHIIHPKPLILLRQTIQVFLHENVLLIHIRKYQVHLRRVPSPVPGPPPHDRADYLQHRCYARPACDHPEMPHQAGRVDHGAFRPFHLERLADGEVGDVLRDVAGGVGFYEQVEEAVVSVGGDRGVGADDFLGLACNGGGDGHVLADGEAEDVARGGQGEAVATDVSARDKQLF